MSKLSYDPYESCILTQRLAPIMDRQAVMKKLQCLPTMPPNVGQIERAVRMHAMQRMVEFHVPSLEELRLYETIDLMLRTELLRRDPTLASTWRTVSGEVYQHARVCSSAPSCFVEGPSGNGKSQGILRCLSLQPSLIPHERFPMCVGGLQQVVSFSVNAPGRGRLFDLATDFMRKWEADFATDRFERDLKRRDRDGQGRFNTCCQVAKSSFLGIFHIDDVEHFFRIPPVKERRTVGKDVPRMRELRVVEDECLKGIANFLNTQGIPLILSGTNDGAAALQMRLSNAQRLATTGYHRFMPFSSAKDPEFRYVFLPALGQYQFVLHPVAVDDALAELIYQLTAGVRRIIMNLWMAAHRVAFERRSDDCLLHEDFRQAARTYLAPVADAVAALLSRDPIRMSHYEDLLPRTESTWTAFWA